MQEESLRIVIGTVTECERVPGTERLCRLVIDIGEKSVEIASALPYFFEDKTSLGRQVPVKTNVQPVVMHGITSAANRVSCIGRARSTWILLGRPLHLWPRRRP